MEKDLVEYLHEVVHNSVILKCRSSRDDESDARRLLAELKITSDSIADISNKLKTNSKITVSELRILKNGLMDDAKNAEIFLNTDGALTGLARVMSGNNKSKQLMAAGCCCNLSLGGGGGGECAAVAAAAGAGLVAGLASLRREYAATCAWTVGNLCVGGVKSCETLVAQGALEKLCEMLYSQDELVWDAVVYALVRLAGQMGDRLSFKYMEKIQEGLFDHYKLTMESSQLMFILSCHKDFLQSTAFVCVEEYFGLYFLTVESTGENVDYHLEYCKLKKMCCKTEFLLRILANVDRKLHTLTTNMFLGRDMLIPFTTFLDKQDVLSESLMWVLGNLLNDGVNGAILFDDKLINRT